MEFVTEYRSIKKKQLKNIRYYIRYFALSSLAIGSKINNAKKFLKAPRIQFIYLHHLFNDEEKKFRLIIDELRKDHIFISHSEAVNRILNNNIDQPYISVSSDDGFKNNILMAKILNEYDIKACFFVNPDTIGLVDKEKIVHFCHNQLRFPPVEFMNWNDIEALQKSGHEIGSHAIGHIDIAQTDINKVEYNLIKSKEILVRECGRIEHFAFPFGRFFNFNLQAYCLVFKLGFKSCSSAERGCHITNRRINESELLIRRDHIICDWSINHIMHFIINNSKTSHYNNNFIKYLYENNNINKF